MKIIVPQKTKSPGFNLFEALLVLGIVSLIFAILIPAIIIFNHKQTLESTAQTLKIDLRFAQDSAISGKRFYISAGCPNGPTPPYESLMGWYVTFSKETAENTRYGIRGLCSEGTVFAGKDTNLPREVIISEIEEIKNQKLKKQSKLVVFFNAITNNVSFYKKPPNPEQVLGDDKDDEEEEEEGDQIKAREVRITLRLESRQYYIYIKDSGEIYDQRVK